MHYPFYLPGHEELKLTVTSPGLISGSQLFQDGKKLARQKGDYMITAQDGNIIPVKFKRNADFLHPKLLYNGEVYTIFREQPTYLTLFSYAPLLLIAIGGLLGGTAGGVGCLINFSILESPRSLTKKVTLCSIVTLVAFIVFALMEAIIQIAME